MEALAKVDAPADKVEENVPAPETANVLPSVVAPVTPKVLDKVVAPDTPSVPAITVLPLVAATVNLLVLTATSPLTPNVPATDVAPNVDAPADNVEEKVPAAALKFPVKLNDVPVAAPITGVIKVGVFAKTNAPVPVSSVIVVIKFALVGVANNVATPVPNPLIPVETGRPVPFVKVTDEGVPKLGVTKVGLLERTKLPVPVDVVVPVPPYATPIVEPFQTPLVIVATEDKLDVTTVDFKVVPVNVPASAATVISALPSNAIPLMFLVAANFVAVLALPVKAPVNPVEVTEVNPVTEVTVPPKVIVVLPKVVVLFINCAFVIAAFEARFEVVNPVTEMVPEEREIPDPAVNPSWMPKPEMSARVIFNLENAMAAEASTSALTMADLVAKDPKPKFVLAPEAVVAPVPPLAIAISVALQMPEVILPVKDKSPVKNVLVLLLFPKVTVLLP
jgi:hypothetical protein